MGRPARYDTDSLLDVAVTLAADRGPQAVTMAAVIEAAAAPSGSLYHRFPSRPALQAALWLRTIERFQAGFLRAARGEDALGAALSAAAHTIEWSRAHDKEARLLLYGAADFGAATWAESDRERLAAHQAEITAAVDALAAKLDLQGDAHTRTMLATVDLPLALVRRQLASGKPVPAGAEQLVEPAVRALLYRG